MMVPPLLFLVLVSQCIRGAVAGQCWQGATYSETVITPALKSSSILRVPEVDVLTRCVAACCDLPGCDLAWLFERRCYVLSCQHPENCQPKKRTGTGSLIAFVQRRPPQALVLQSLVRGEPYPNHWRPLPRHGGAEDPLTDLAMLGGMQDLGGSEMENADGLRGEEDRVGDEEETDRGGDAEALTQENPGIVDWPAVAGRGGYNQSELEGGEGKVEPPQEGAESSPPPSAPPGGVDESGAHPSAADLSVSPPATAPVSLPTDVGLQQNHSAPVTEETPLPQGTSIDWSTPSQATTRPPSSPSPPHSAPPAPPHLMPSQPGRALQVSLGDPVDVTLPQDTVELTVSVIPDSLEEDVFTYEWSLVSSPNGQQGALEGTQNTSATLSGLSEGLHVVQVRVRGKQAYGESTVNITVHPAEDRSRLPDAVAFPELQKLPALATASINGSLSRVGAGPVRYLWTQVGGPPCDDGGSADTPVLHLQDLLPGEYTFRLTVTDSVGQTDSTTAVVWVTGPKDDPPRADPGPDQIITLPQDRLSLWGNQSSDDLGISSYLWSLRSSSQDTGITMQGATEPFLQLGGLQEGQYTFQLTVTDTRGQQDSSTVKVTVLPENRPPVAVVGDDRQLVLPEDSLMLDGSQSSDEQQLSSYHWDSISGPPGAKIKDPDKLVTEATGLRAGSHKFRLTVRDQQGAEGSAVLAVTVKEAKHLPLVAHASGSHTLTLPNNSLVLRGSVSNAGPTNVTYLWVRDEQSPAAGDILYGSEHQASLFLANLVEGNYLFHLRVTDSQGRSSAATATVDVSTDPREREEVELELQVGVAQVSLQQKEKLVRQLAALLHTLDTDIALKGLHAQSDLSTVWRFSVQGPDGTFPGPKLARLLRNQLMGEKSDFLLFRVLRVDTVMCLLLCSGRGGCDPVTRSCACDPLWMENPFRRLLGDGESNCDWSVLYVTISSIMLIVLLLSVSWMCVCCFRRGRRTKVRKKTKYTILDNMDEQERMELRPKYNIKHRSTAHNSSLMMSESECDSDQDVVFSYERTDRARNRPNGTARNGGAFGLRAVDG